MGECTSAIIDCGAGWSASICDYVSTKHAQIEVNFIMTNKIKIQSESWFFIGFMLQTKQSFPGGNNEACEWVRSHFVLSGFLGGDCDPHLRYLGPVAHLSSRWARRSPPRLVGRAHPTCAAQFQIVEHSEIPGVFVFLWISGAKVLLWGK